MPRLLTPDQIAAAAKTYGIDPAALRAVLQVESQGCGFLPSGKPKILLERHILWERLLSPEHGPVSPTPLYHAHPDICNPTRTPTGGYGTEDEQWTRLQTVIDWAQNHDPAHVETYRKCAYEASSWGLAQILGENYAEAEFANVLLFAQAMATSEAEQLDIMLRWISHNGLLGYLQTRQWMPFAHGYNGPAEFGSYADKLVAAFRSFGGR